jgi:hypothetical protein
MRLNSFRMLYPRLQRRLYGLCALPVCVSSPAGWGGVGVSLLCLPIAVLLWVPPPAVEANSYLWHPAFPMGRETLHYGQYREVKLPSKVNINTASYDDLILLPGVNSHIAIALMKHRPYKSLHDLAQLHPSVPLSEVKLLQRKLNDAVRFEGGQAPNSYFSVPKDVTKPRQSPQFRLAI